MRTRAFWKIGATVSLGLTLALSGCGGSSDSPTDPGGGGGGGTLSDPEAVMAIDFAMPIALGMVEQSMAVGSLDLGTLNAPPDMGFGASYAYAPGDSFAIAWDDGNDEYVVRYVVDQLPAMGIDFEHRVQYRDATGSPEGFLGESLETTDGARFGTSSSVFMNMGLALQQEGVEGTALIEYDATTTLSGRLGPTYEAVGSGNYGIDVAMVVTNEGQVQTLDLDLDMEYAMDLAIPSSGGCPTGTASMSYDGYRVDLTFDGTATAAWSLTRLSDQQVLVSGTESANCGVAAR